MKRFIALTLALILSAAFVTAAAATAPAKLELDGTGGSVTLSQDALSPLLDPERQLRGVVITDFDSGAKVTCAGRELLAGEGVTAENLDGLTFTPSGDARSLTLLPVYTDGTGEKAAVISVTAGENQSPDARDMVVDTYRGVSRTESFAADDPEGDGLEFTLISEPSKGAAVANEDGTFTYTPAPGKAGRDTFTYTATDSAGNVSRQALVTVNISRRAPAVNYADTAGTAVEYQAARMAQEGIFVGEQINGSHYFSPEKTVSRGDFLAMTVKAAGIESLNVSSAGFDDDEGIASWQAGYIAAAREAGAVNGIELEGKRLFQSARAITGREACRVVAGLMGFDEGLAVETSAVEGDWAGVWSEAARANGFAAAETFSAGEITRADAAKIIVSMMDHQ